MKGKISILITLLLQGVFSPTAFAQITGPEQDCIGAIPVCQTVFVQNQSYQGIGDVDDLMGINSCLDNNENNSVWYIFTISNSGVLEFSIIPQAGDDYDFALYNLTGGSCNDILNGTSGVEVRCGYSFTNGPTGLKSGYIGISGGIGDTADFLAPINVVIGETYALLVDNFSSTLSGYTLDFAPSANTTASILDFIPPEIDSIVPPTCDSTSSVTVMFSEPIHCNSLQINGGNFSVTGPSAVSVTGVVGSGCQNGSRTSSIKVNFLNPITVAGMYSLIFNPNTSGGAIQDLCGNNMLPDTIPFYSPSGITTSFSFDCTGLSIAFENESFGDSLSYEWLFGDGDTSEEQHPTHVYAPGTYTVSLTTSNSVCSISDSATFTAVDSFSAEFQYSPDTIHRREWVNFQPLITYASTYKWTFGDNGTSSQKNSTHRYNVIGNYEVCLIALFQCYADTVCKNLEVIDATSAQEIETASFLIQISPNPVEGQVRVQLTDLQKPIGEAALYNMLGEKLFTQMFSAAPFNLDFTTLSAGVYFLKIESGKSFAVKEIVKL